MERDAMCRHDQLLHKHVVCQQWDLHASFGLVQLLLCRWMDWQELFLAGEQLSLAAMSEWGHLQQPAQCIQLLMHT
jgi:hypothetical protein